MTPEEKYMQFILNALRQNKDSKLPSADQEVAKAIKEMHQIYESYMMDFDDSNEPSYKNQSLQPQIFIEN